MNGLDVCVCEFFFCFWHNHHIHTKIAFFDITIIKILTLSRQAVGDKREISKRVPKIATRRFEDIYFFKDVEYKYLSETPAHEMVIVHRTKKNLVYK